MSELLDNLRSRGYWRVVIRPGTFIEQRVSNISALYPILQKISVQLRGWGFPHLDSRDQPHIDTDWIGQESEWERYLEVWRFYSEWPVRWCCRDDRGLARSVQMGARSGGLEARSFIEC